MTEPAVTPDGLTKADVSSEIFREYVFSDGFTYHIKDPIRLYIKHKPEGDSHRVVDSDAVVHYIPADWRILRWAAKTNRPEVEF